MKTKCTLIFFLSFFLTFTLYAQYKLEEDFSSATFPPAGWTRGPNISDGVFAPVQPQWDRRSASAYGIGEGSAQVFFYDISQQPIDSLSSPVFASTIPTDSLYFDHAHRTTTPFMAVDELRIYTSNNGGADFVLFQVLLGGEGGELVTEPADNIQYESPAIWALKKYELPLGVNKIRFESFSANGNNLFLDNIRIGKPFSVVPVSLLSFTGIKNGNEVQLKWIVSSEIKNSGFDVEKLTGSFWQKIITLKSKGNSNIRTEYIFNDKSPADGYNYYRLKQIDIDGREKYSDIIKIQFSIDRNGYSFQNFPNPFTTNTSIHYEVPERAHVRLAIFDLQGKHITTLINETKHKGSYKAIWNAAGKLPGSYFCKAIIGNKTYSIQMNKIN